MSQIRSVEFQSRRQQAVLARCAALTLRRSVPEALLHHILTPDGDSAPLRLPPAAVASGPAQLAAAQCGDASQRRELVIAYEGCLRTYRELARAHTTDAADDDLGAALAFFVAVNLHALQGVDIGRDVLPVLERQLRGVGRLASRWDTLSLAARQTCFERIAILSILVSGSFVRATAQGPRDVAKVRHAAREYLQQLLGIDPDGLSLGATGLVVGAKNAPLGTGGAALSD